jgi:starch-binding outer membrane protein, SusD/RagB family
VIDGGAPLPFTIHFARADSAFSEALTIAQSQHNSQYVNAALAGRASVRIWEGDWAGATADAAQVPESFTFSANYNIVDANQYNSVQYATSSSAGHRNFSQYNTFYGANFDQFADPRTPYIKYPDIPFKVGLGSLPDLGDGRGIVGAVPYYQQQKYKTPADPIRLSSGREMLLVIAESKLRSGDWPGALNLINQIRAEVGVAQRQATSADETWTWLKLEKLIEIWLEGRAVGERRRWNGEGVDGPAPGPLPALLDMTDRTGKDDCWPISQSEATTNPNIGH